MRTFEFVRASSVAGAVDAAREPERHFIAGGTTLVDLMKLDVETPAAVIDINRLPLAAIAPTPEGGLRIGALARNADVAHDPAVRRDYPVLAEAILAGASAQLRNMASTAGNLLQRTRCLHFRDTAAPCNKREPGTGCSAIGGYNRNLAIFGVSDRCIATNPSDQNVALSALEARVEIEGPGGRRTVEIADFFLEPGETPHIETVLQPGELITAVVLPAPARGARSTYLKLRDRASYEFALASAAVIATVADGSIAYLRIAMGGVGTVPWRCANAESLLTGRAPSGEAFERAADAVLSAAQPQPENRFKLELTRRCLVHALTTATTAA